MAKKYDWTKLKQEYFNSPYMTVEEFFRLAKGKPKASEVNGAIGRATRGWAEEKSKLQVEAQKKATELTKQELVEKYKVTTDYLLQMKQAVISRCAELIKVGGQSATDLKTLWSVIKTELEEPTTIIRNKNENTNVTDNDMIDMLRMIKKAYDREHNTGIIQGE